MLNSNCSLTRVCAIAFGVVLVAAGGAFFVVDRDAVVATTAGLGRVPIRGVEGETTTIGHEGGGGPTAKSVDVKKKKKTRPSGTSGGGAHNRTKLSPEEEEGGVDGRLYRLRKGKRAEGTGKGEGEGGMAGNIRSIHFIGERHSGTNWIYHHLVDCFGHEVTLKNKMARWKHWFQYNDLSRIMNNSLVIAQFRDPYDWVEALRHRAYHSPSHMYIADWYQYVTSPWTMPRPHGDYGRNRNVTSAGGKRGGPGATGKDTKRRICQARFTYDEVVPCSPYLRGPHNALYERNVDGSGRSYGSIVDLRADKIRNFLSTVDYPQVDAMIVTRYEELAARGTDGLLTEVERLTGVERGCKAFGGDNYTRAILDPEYVEWMNDNVDWSAEAMVGYSRLGRRSRRVRRIR